jgi:hypothetical protein
MMKKDYDYTIGQLDEIGEVVHKFQSALTTVKAKKIQNVLNSAFIQIDDIVREK